MSSLDDKKTLKKKYIQILKCLEKSGLKQKNAVSGQKRCVYSRGEDLYQIIKNNFEKIKDLSQDVFPMEDDSQLHQFMEHLLSQGVILKFERPTEMEKFKWPKKLLLSDKKWDAKQFYTFNIEYSSSYKTFLLLILIGVVLCVCLMPVWPDEFKSVILYVNIGLLYALFGVMFLRLIIYFLIRIFGVEFWLFPNYLEDCGFFESFKPFYSCEKCQDGFDGFVSRFFGVIVASYIFYSLYEDPEILTGNFINLEFTNIGVSSFHDIHDWALKRLTVDPDRDLHKRAIPGFQDILKLTSENTNVNVNGTDTLNFNLNDKEGL